MLSFKSRLVLAIRNNDITLVEELLNHKDIGTHINNALMWAKLNKRKKIKELLIDWVRNNS